MTREILFAALLAAATLASPAQSQNTPNLQEKAMIEQMREAAKRQGMALTPEMEAMALNRMREVQANMLGLQMAAQGMQDPGKAPEAPINALAAKVPPVAQAPDSAAGPAAVPAAPAADWLEAIARHRSHAKPTAFADARDGFTVEGRSWMDAEGQITSYNADRATGNVTYFVDQGAGQYALRFANVHAPDAPVTVGKALISDQRQSYQGFDGTQLAGERLFPLADGLIASRGNAFFHYTYGAPPVSRNLLEGYTVAPTQGGDIGGTGYLLVFKKAKRGLLDGNRPDAIEGKPPALFGKKDPDFALVDIRSGAQVILPRSEGTTHFKWENRFLENGRRNSQHVGNAIAWHPTSIGPIALVFADNGMAVYALHLPSGRQVEILTRRAGINEWRAGPTEGGGLMVEAQMGFRMEAIEDVRTFFTGSP